MNAQSSSTSRRTPLANFQWPDTDLLTARRPSSANDAMGRRSGGAVRGGAVNAGRDSTAAGETASNATSNHSSTAVDGGTQTAIEMQTQTSPGLLRNDQVPNINVRSPTTLNASNNHVTFAGNQFGNGIPMAVPDTSVTGDQFGHVSDSLIWVTSTDAGFLHPGTTQG